MVCVCVCLVGKRSNLEGENDRGKVCFDQLHSKSVYSAQFGIKHNRLLSACYCLWCPIKMEFIAALRASPNPTFFPLCSVLLHPSLICTLSFLVEMVMALVQGVFCPHFQQQLSDKSSERLITDPNRQVWLACPPTCQHITAVSTLT